MFSGNSQNDLTSLHKPQEVKKHTSGEAATSLLPILVSLMAVLIGAVAYTRMS